MLRRRSVPSRAPTMRRDQEPRALVPGPTSGAGRSTCTGAGISNPPSCLCGWPGHCTCRQGRDPTVDCPDGRDNGRRRETLSRAISVLQWCRRDKYVTGTQPQGVPGHRPSSGIGAVPPPASQHATRMPLSTTRPLCETGSRRASLGSRRGLTDLSSQTASTTAAVFRGAEDQHPPYQRSTWGGLHSPKARSRRARGVEPPRTALFSPRRASATAGSDPARSSPTR